MLGAYNLRCLVMELETDKLKPFEMRSRVRFCTSVFDLGGYGGLVNAPVCAKHCICPSRHGAGALPDSSSHVQEVPDPHG